MTVKAVDPLLLMLCMILVTGHPDSDADYAAYCTSLIVEKDGVFVRRLLGENLPANYNEHPHPYAAELFRKRLRELFESYLNNCVGLPNPNAGKHETKLIRFSNAVKVLAFRLFEMEAKPDVMITFDPQNVKSEILLEPMWWCAGEQRSSKAFGANFGFSRSVISPKSIVGTDFNRLSTKLAAIIYPRYDEVSKKEALALQPDREKANAFNTLLQYSYNDIKGCEFDEKPTINYGASILIDTINRDIPVNLQMAPLELAKLAARINELRSGVNFYPARKTHDGDLVPRSHRSHAMRKVIANVFGISRETASTWIDAGKQHQRDVAKWFAEYHFDLEALLR